MPSVYEPQDRSDELYERDLQRQLDAFAEGRRAGRLGIGAGLCPQDYSEDEKQHWRLGHNQGSAT